MSTAITRWSYASKIPEALERAGLGQEPVFAVNENLWYAKSGNVWMQHLGLGIGLGALTDSAVQTAAQALQSYLSSNGSVTTSFQECTDFQNAYNAAGGQIEVDGKYGPCCQQALQAVWDAAVAGGSGAAQQAPTTGFGGSCSNGQYVPGTSNAAGTQDLPEETVTGTPPGGGIGAGTAILIGAGVFAAGLVSWALLSKKKPHGGGHRSRRPGSRRHKLLEKKPWHRYEY